MTQASRYASLSNEQLAELHAQCELFELALQRSETISLEECLAKAPGAIHDFLFQELLAIELEWRLPHDSWPHLAGYQARFPNRHPDIERVVAEVSKAWLAKQDMASAGIPANAVQNFDGRYRLDGEIARGGMGVIFKGSDTTLQRELAVKVLADEHKHNPEVIQRFIKEAQIGGQLQHPGIAPVYDLGQFADARPFFSMKLVKGQTLATLLASREAPSEERARFLGIFLKVCQTVAYAHEQGVLHRDLKPLNIMVGAFGEVQVMDWGLAKLLPRHGLLKAQGSDDTQNEDEPSAHVAESDVSHERKPPPSPAKSNTSSTDSSQTQLGCVMGTPAYMSPEQAQGQVSQLDERVDVFGLGAILCEILTGLPPYVGSNRTQTLQLALTGSLDECFTRLDACAEDADLLEIAKACLQTERQNRTRDAGLLAKQIASYLESVDLKLRATEMERATHLARLEQEQRSAARLWSMVLVLAGVAGVAVLAAVVAGMSWQAANTAKLSAEFSEKSLRKSQAAEKLAAVTANALRIDAEQHLVKAEAAEKNAVAQRHRADTAADTTQQNLYFAEMHLAQQAWREHRGLLNMRVLLDKWRPKQQTPDRRGWEWFYLDSLPEQNVTTLTNAGILHRPASVAWHVPSNRLAEGGPDGAINIRDGIQGKILLTLSGPVPEVPFWGRNWFAWSGDGNSLVAGGRDGNLSVWDTRSGRQLHAFQGFSSPVGAVTFSSDAKRLTAWAANEAIKSWDLQSGMLTASHIQPDDISAMAWSPDDQLFATGHSDGRVTIANAQTGDTLASWQAHIDLIYHLAWSPDSRRLASTSSNDFFVNIWDVATKEKIEGPLRHSHGITSMAWEPSGKRLATGSMDETIKIWNASNGHEDATLRGHRHAIVSLTWGTDGRFASVDDWGGFKIWNDINDQDASRLLGDARVSSVAWSPDGHHLASGSDDGKLRIWDAGTRKKVSEFEAHQPQQSLVLPSGHISSLAWSPDGKLLASASMDGTARVSVVADGRELYRLPAEHGLLWSVAWNAAGTHLAVAADDGQLIVISGFADTPQPKAYPTAHRGIRGVAWSPQGDHLAMAGGDGLVTLWDATRNSEIRQLRDHTETVTDLAWSPDGQRLASAGTDNLVIVWDVSTGKKISTLSGHSTWIESVVWSPDGKRIASAGMDSTVRIWDPRSGKEAFVLRGNYGRFHDVAWHPDGAEIAAASSDGQVWLWKASRADKPAAR